MAKGRAESRARLDFC